jgi:1-acyl-sn-glycerol-3-phosphate acyltransferase
MLSSHPNLIVVIAEKYGKKPFLKWVINILGFIFIDRYNPDVRAVREVIKRLKQNGFMLIAPEGTRSPNGSLIEGNPGTAYLAAKTDATILPISLLGCEDSTLRTRLLKLKRLDINVRVGKPYNIPKLPRGNREEFLQKYTDEIMCRIAALLPPSRHGFYSEYPRIKDLLISKNNE